MSDEAEPGVLGSRAGAGSTPALSELDAIRDEIAAEDAHAEQDEDKSLVRLEVPERPGWVIVCTTKGITYNKVLAWRRMPVVKDKNSPGGVSDLMSAAVILGEQCKSIIRNGNELVHEGAPVTFRDQPYRDIFDAGDAVEAVLKTFKNDWHAISASQRLMIEAGFGYMVGVVDEDAMSEASPTGR